MDKELEIHKNKRNDKIYISKSFERTNPLSDEVIKTRQITKVFDVADFHFFEYLKDYKTIVLRKTEKEREEVKITVIEDGKKVAGISIQRFMVKSGMPKKESFFLSPEEFKKMIELLRSIEFIDFSNPSHFQLKDSELKENITELVEVIEKIPKGNLDKETLFLVLNKISEDEKVASLISGLTEDEKNLLSTNHIEIKRKRVLDDLSERLTKSFSETTGDDSWQKWISQNCWLTGANYLKPIEKQKINITGVMPDYLFPTHDGFIDILEIKLPKDSVIKEDSSHPGSWVWSGETNKAIGQVVNYMGEIERMRLELEKQVLDNYKIEVSFLKPRSFILIGDDNSWYEGDEHKEIKRNKKLEGLRKLNCTLHGIEVITYSELLRRGNTFISTKF